ncbi:MAG: ABC transporter ATP-binding protein [Mesorhizobium amorphae]|nr:MAG: ABC transporter ATP-binding protein [Mesorhizobium amorphae]
MDPAQALPPDTPLISAENVSRHFGGLRAVDGMSLRLPRGGMVGLIGPNGAGKTTLFNLLAGALKPSGGTIRIAGRDVSHESPEMRIRRGVGRTFQIPRPFNEMTVLENVLVGAQNQSGERVWNNFIAPARVWSEERAALNRARELIDFVSLSHLVDQPARVLSGGQRKLLELARVLMAEPDAILLDEPAAGVNPSLLELIIDRVQTLNKEGRTVLLIEHNMDMVSRLCSHVVVMASGRLLAEGSPQAVVRDPAVVSAYLGEAA